MYSFKIFKTINCKVKNLVICVIFKEVVFVNIDCFKFVYMNCDHKLNIEKVD